MNVFNNLSYRDILSEKVQSIKKAKPGAGLLRMCKQAGLYGSFVSSALKGHKHLNQDQIFALGEVLGFSSKELDYLLLLMNYERAVNQSLKSKLKEQIDSIQSKYKKTTSHIETKPQESLDLYLAEYYSDPYFKIIHVFLGVEKFNSNALALSEQLNISPQRVQDYLRRLEEMGIVKIEADHVKVLKKNYHLPKDFFMCKPHQASMKLLSQTTLLNTNEEKKENVCVTFSGERETYKNVHQEFLEFLKRTEKHVKNSEPVEVFQINFDLHYWSK